MGKRNRFRILELLEKTTLSGRRYFFMKRKWKEMNRNNTCQLGGDKIKKNIHIVIKNKYGEDISQFEGDFLQ